MRMCLVSLLSVVLFFFCISHSRASEVAFDLQSVITYALQHNPSLRISERNIQTEKYGIDAARAERMPRVDVNSGVTRYRYPTPLTPIVLSGPLVPALLELPDFERTIYDGGASFRLPLYRGGRITRNIRIAETRKGLAEDSYAVSRQDLIYNLTSVYHKILQLQKLLLSNEASVTQLESHRHNVDLLLKGGSVPKLDLLKTDVELAHARDNVLLVRNNLDSAFELLKTLMGMDEPNASISIAPQPLSEPVYPSEEESMKTALYQRPDYRAVAKKTAIAEDRVKLARGKHFPDIYGTGQYIKRGGEGTSFKEDWFLGLRMTIPVFDGGLIRSEVNRERIELEKVKEEERSLRQSISREVKDSRLSIANAADRIAVAEAAMASAREAVRVEVLKYESGGGTSTDVIDAQTALLRAETDYYQAAYDREVALASLRKAMGLNPAEQEVLR